MNTWILKKAKQPIADIEKLFFWIEGQTSHNIPLNQNVIQNKAQTSILWRLREKLQKESLKLAMVALWTLKKSSLAKCKAKQQMLIIETAASYPKDFGKLNEGGFTKQICSVDKTALYWKKIFHLGLWKQERRN